MIDLHSHILPGLDDGAPDMHTTIGIARMAAADGVSAMVATPHIREDFPFPVDQIAARVLAVNDQLRSRDIRVDVRRGGEVAVSKLPDLDDATLAGLCLGEGSYVLVESPYLRATDLFEMAIFDLQVRGFSPVLAHPERSPSFQRHPDRLARMVDKGVLCSVTAASMAGRFGRTVQQFTRTLFESGLVHNVASDCHDSSRRPPGLGGGFRVLERELPGMLEQIEWFTQAVPEAILAGTALPARPAPPGRTRGRWPGRAGRRNLRGAGA
jgi:protein-tyrosine phosphatase